MLLLIIIIVGSVALYVVSLEWAKQLALSVPDVITQHDDHDVAEWERVLLAIINGE